MRREFLFVDAFTRTQVRNKLKIKAENAEIDGLFEAIDADHGGTIDFQELVQACHMLNSAAQEGRQEAGQCVTLAEDMRARASLAAP